MVGVKNLIRITINIPELVRGGTFDVPIDECPKPSEDFSGVEVEISDWWEEGNQNHGFIKKIVHIGVPKLTRQVGRRYSTLLRKKLLMRINNKKCPIFHHCAWASNRFVERRGRGRIPARFDFKEVLKIERRCYACGTLIPDPTRDACEKCKSSEHVKTRECTIKGWVGIQRFDDQNKFGLDFIRNGRAILIDEKEGVFTWTPTATGEKIQEYPVDAIYGRIIGEVHIDHVPTDFLKTDFQKTSPEWVETIKFLRGESCLLPDTQRSYNEPDNDSPIYKLFQGYRRVRTPGRADMYMGYWDESKGGPTRDCNKRGKDETGEHLSWEKHLRKICTRNTDMDNFESRRLQILKHITEGKFAYPRLSKDEKNSIRVIAESLYHNITTETENSLSLYERIAEAVVKASNSNRD